MALCIISFEIRATNEQILGTQMFPALVNNRQIVYLVLLWRVLHHWVNLVSIPFKSRCFENLLQRMINRREPCSWTQSKRKRLQNDLNHVYCFNAWVRNADGISYDTCMFSAGIHSRIRCVKRLISIRIVLN